MSARTPDPSFDAAGAHKPEPDPSERVAAVPFLVDAQLYRAYGDSVQRRGAHEISSTPHRRAVVARSDSADPKGWVSPSRPEAIQGHAVTAVSVAPIGLSVETWGHRPAATLEAAGDIPGSVPAGHSAYGDAVREHRSQFRLLSLRGLLGRARPARR